MFYLFPTVQTSFWPLTVSISLFSLLANASLYLNAATPFVLLLLSFFFTFISAFLWWKDVVRESLLGTHNHKLDVSLRAAFLLFILSEVCFFFSFFWAFFDAFLSPTVEIGLTWPPNGILPLSPLSVPLLNTVILLVSGITVTWSHHAIVSKDYQSFIVSLFLTISLGGYFTYLQYTEYCTAPFSISDGIYGSTFFVATGFHGIHVMVGATYLAYVLVLASQASLTSVHHFSFEAASWYWHFVDVVWIFLFLNIYVAGAVS